METKTKIFGMPLFSIGLHARGFIAIGWVARGVITIAQFGYGFIAVTQFGFGFFSLSQFGFGLVSVAQFGLGLILGVGQGTVGFIANGLGAAGYYAMKGPGVWDRFPVLLSMVMADPVPLCIWTAAWAAVFIFLWSQRDKITIGMSPGDLFRSRRRNRIDRIRAKAVSEISDQKELAEIVLNDQSDMVRMAALKNIADPGLLTQIAKSTMSEEVAGYVTGKIDSRDMLLDAARSAMLPAVKIGAVARLTKLDPYCLVDLACREGDSLVIQQIISGIRDRASLEKIIREAASPHAKTAAINSLEKPDQEFLRDITGSEKEIAVCEAAVLRITDTAILSGIVLGSINPGVQKAAIEQISDKKLLSELAAGNIPETVRKAIERRLKDIRPLYYSLKIEFSCPFCSQPVFVNGPIKKAKCQSCLRESTLTRELWEKISGAGFGKIEFSSPLSFTAEKNVIGSPLCSSCGASLDTDDIAAGARTMPPCPSCRAPQSTFPVPEWLPWSQNAEQVFCAEEVGTPSPGEKEIKPVAISCIKCGAPLEITAETPRNATCTYCNTKQYLPDPLWLSLHPVKIKQAWYIRCSFRERLK
jgi:hypothetical protein